MHVTSKGQVTIPRDIRERFHITADTEVDFVCEGEGGDEKILLIPRPKSTEHFEQFSGTADIRLSTEEIMQLTRGEDA